MANTTEQTVSIEPTQPLLYYPAERSEVLRVGILGLLAGILVPLLALLITTYAVNPIFCRDANAGGVCAAEDMTIYYVASALVAIVMTGFLTNFGVFRPLVVAAGATVALWGLERYITGITSNWIEYYLFSAILYLLAYLLMYWLMRLRNFVASLVLAVAVVLILRWALIA